MGNVAFLRLTLAFPVAVDSKEYGPRLSPSHPVLFGNCLAMAISKNGKIDQSALEQTLDYVVKYQAELTKATGGKLLFPDMGTLVSKTISRKLKDSSLSVAIAGKEDFFVVNDDGLDGPEVFEGSGF
jgi:hypothetical protein